MALLVQKFGGSSLATAEKVMRAAKRAVAQFEDGRQVVVVVSAQGDYTDHLIEMARAIHASPDPRELDALIAVGEQVSSALMALAIHKLGYGAISLTGAQAGIRTDEVSTKARIRTIDTARVRSELAEGRIVIVAGFQGVDREDNITTLGRGGSDTTAVALAAALGAERCDIFTDVEGIYTADPRIVPEARWTPSIDYDELLEMASLGAQVIHYRAVELAKRYDVVFRVRPSYNESEGTLVCNLSDQMEQVDVRGAALDAGEAKVTIRGVPDQPGVAARIFSRIARDGINVDMIVQNVSEQGLADVSFTVMESELTRAMDIAESLSDKLSAAGAESDSDIAKLSIVGIGMRSHAAVADKMFRALAEEGINILMISTSEIKLSCVIRRAAGEKALRAVHRAFELDRESQPEE
ncbi:MAG: aspartate kinase [Planctomycetes bacterium]|nr:aspartate kinase [Planctomycetota bacterium]